MDLQSLKLYYYFVLYNTVKNNKKKDEYKNININNYSIALYICKFLRKKQLVIDPYSILLIIINNSKLDFEIIIIRLLAFNPLSINILNINQYNKINIKDVIKIFNDYPMLIYTSIDIHDLGIILSFDSILVCKCLLINPLLFTEDILNSYHSSLTNKELELIFNNYDAYYINRIKKQIFEILN